MLLDTLSFQQFQTVILLTLGLDTQQIATCWKLATDSKIN
jgi:hypothetical protein